MRHPVRTALLGMLAGAGLAAATLAGATLAGPAASAGASPGGGGAVYAISNDPAANAVVTFARRSDGSLVPGPAVPTGGRGTGADLGSQGAVVLSDGGDWLVTVNPGSDDVSLFAVDGGRIRLVDTAPSGGDMPISVTVHHRSVYVLNAGDDTVSGLRIGRRSLEPVPHSTRPLSDHGVGPAQVEFTPTGRQLVVTEKNTNRIDVFPVAGGVAGAVVANPSNGVTPFGFAFGRGRLIVSNANGSAVNGSSLTSYDVRRNGAVASLDGPDGTNQTAACWVVVTRNGRYVYTTNTGSASVTGYRLGGDGRLSILDAGGVTGATGMGPIDVDLSRDSRFLYTLATGSNTITIHRVGADGSLTPLGTVAGIPATTIGLAAA